MATVSLDTDRYAHFKCTAMKAGKSGINIQIRIPSATVRELGLSDRDEVEVWMKKTGVTIAKRAVPPFIKREDSPQPTE